MTGSRRWPSRSAADNLPAPYGGSSYTVETELLMGEIERLHRTHLVPSSVRPSSTPSWTGRPTRWSTCTRCSTARWSCSAARSAPASRWSRTTTARCPRSRAYAGELNQVWTNLIDNAVSAMDGAGTLTVRTAHDRDQVLVEIRGHRSGRSRGHPGPDLRTLLHHETGGRGHRARPRHLVAHRREETPRRPPGGVRSGRHPLPGPAPADRPDRRHLIHRTCPATGAFRRRAEDLRPCPQARRRDEMEPGTKELVPVMRNRKPSVAMCPVRPGDPCSLCMPGATGPQDCGLVYLVLTDPDLRAQLRGRRCGPLLSRQLDPAGR